MKICLIGSIPKGDDNRETWIDWKISYKNKLSGITNLEFTDGDLWKDESQPFLLVGHDAYQIKMSDIIIVNAEKKLGAGSAQEMLIAKYFSKPVITVLPKNSHHRKQNIKFDGCLIEDWIHPFVMITSDLIVEKIEDAVEWIRAYENKPRSVKDITVIDKAIEAYTDFVKMF